MCTFAPLFKGGVAEWSNAPVLKTDVPQGTGGSNPSTSAKRKKTRKPKANATGFFVQIRFVSHKTLKAEKTNYIILQAPLYTPYI